MEKFKCAVTGESAPCKTSIEHNNRVYKGVCQLKDKNTHDEDWIPNLIKIVKEKCDGCFAKGKEEEFFGHYNLCEQSTEEV